jgi:hypothetical protein
MNHFGIKVLLVVIAILIGIIVGLVAGVLSRLGGADLTAAVIRGGVGFGGTVTLVLLIEHALGW